MAVIWGISVTSSVFADATAETGRKRCEAQARSTAIKSADDCDSGVLTTNGTIATGQAVCIRTSSGGPRGAYVGYASAKAGPGFAERVRFARGYATAGLGTSAAADTGAYDSLRVTYANTGLNQTTLTISGLIMADVAGSTSLGNTKVLVYADTTAANADPTHSGAGALFIGAIHIAAGTRAKLPAAPVVTYSGSFSASDFTVVNGTDVDPLAPRVYLKASALSKVVNSVPDTSKVVIRAYTDVVSQDAVPGASPLALAVLALLLGASAFFVLRRRGSAEIA